VEDLERIHNRCSGISSRKRLLHAARPATVKFDPN
jgi:hypothetical protein